uniref:Uncharacterized protein n=1 Tax=Cajanus cajan TaxID=3821 RepID=A0A151U1L4_CAJCA|nr:hypothetical protein KK1_005800 [Cajanus cajan]
MRKEDGGMVFHNLYSFNLAMLEKLSWKFISYSDALVTCIFKAKYCPSVDFMDSTVDHSLSFCWRRIWNSRVLLREGYRWHIGDGKMINVWAQPWLRSPSQL